jgi:hypothetical protein
VHTSTARRSDLYFDIKNPGTKYKVPPAQAYVDGGEPDGELYGKGGRICPTCGCIATYYSVAGLRELNITGFCEPCFDFTTTPRNDPDDPPPAWMGLVEYTNKEMN